MKLRSLSLLLLFVLTLFGSCKKENEDLNSDGEYYFKGSLNGRQFNWQEKDGEEWHTGTSGSSSRKEGSVMGSLSAWIGKSASNIGISVTFKTFYIPDYQYKADVFNDFVSRGNWPFSESQYDDVDLKGVIIEYTDERGNRYDSLGPQLNSSFKVVSVNKMGPQSGSKESLRISIRLNCRLYPADSFVGEPISLDNAEAELFMENLL